jgi:hypothetical protein
VKWIERILEVPARLARVKRWSYLVLAAIAIGETVVPRLVPGEPPHFWFEDLPAWGSFYGLLSCVLIIKVSKFLGKLWLMRPEDYYERHERDRHETP